MTYKSTFTTSNYIKKYFNWESWFFLGANTISYSSKVIDNDNLIIDDEKLKERKHIFE